MTSSNESTKYNITNPLHVISTGRYYKMDAIPKLRDLVNALHGKATKWYDIGIQLHLSTEELDAIKYDCRGDVNECFRNMLMKWRSKTHPLPTWSALIAALKARAVDEQVLAEELETNFSHASRKSSNMSESAPESKYAPRGLGTRLPRQ